MKLVDFMIYLLKAHAETLQRLAAFFGEENLIEILENIPETADQNPLPSQLNLDWFESLKGSDKGSAYAKLEGLVQEFKLPAVIEFYLWAYPFYRLIVESPLNLNAKILGPESDAGLKLVDQALAYSKSWINQLPVSSELSYHLEKIASVPWLKFRSEVLKKIGKRPLEIRKI